LLDSTTGQEVSAGCLDHQHLPGTDRQSVDAGAIAIADTGHLNAELWLTGIRHACSPTLIASVVHDGMRDRDCSQRIRTIKTRNSDDLPSPVVECGATFERVG